MLHFAAETVALNARRTCVNHVTGTWNGERGFGHVGGQYDAPIAVVVKNTVLLGRTEPGKQRQHFGTAVQRLVAHVLTQVVGGLADFALAGQEDQDVAGVVWVAPELVHAVGNRVVQAVVTAFLERAVALLYREHAPRHHDDRGRAVA